MISKIQIDFQIIDTGDPRVLMIADNSLWGQIENKPKVVEITLPGNDPKTDSIAHYFQPYQINSFNSETLGLTCDTDCPVEYSELPDGVYTITVKGSPEKYQLTRKWLKVDSTQLELDKLFITYYNSCKENNKCFKDLITDIQMLIDGAKASVRFDDVCKAQELLYRAQELTERVKRCKKC
jgi:hypothetical protein